MKPYKKIAKIEVLANELGTRAKKDSKNRGFSGYLKEVVESYKQLESYKKEVLKSKSSDDIKRNLNKFCFHGLGIADSTNRALKAIYGKGKIELKKTLDKALYDAPLSLNDLTFSEEFKKVHEAGEGSILRTGRVDHCHHNPIESEDSPEEIKNWVKEKSNGYSELARVCLQSVADKEKKKLVPRQTNRNYQVAKQMCGDYYNQNVGKTLAIAGGSLLGAGIGAGIIGTLMFGQLEQEKLFNKLDSSINDSMVATKDIMFEAEKKEAKIFCEMAFGMSPKEFSKLDGNAQKDLMHKKMLDHPDYFFDKQKSYGKRVLEETEEMSDMTKKLREEYGNMWINWKELKDSGYISKE